MLKAVLHRLVEEEKQTLGSFTLFDDTDAVFTAKSLELPWLGNEQQISCIPPGNYLCKRRHSSRHGNHFKVTGLHSCEVRDREFILIHKGNFHRDIMGCILLGRDHIDINHDGYRDVTSSRGAIRQLNNSVDEIMFSLTIIDMTRTFE